jgi:hypothetical protein
LSIKISSSVPAYIFFVPTLSYFSKDATSHVLYST